MRTSHQRTLNGGRHIDDHLAFENSPVFVRPSHPHTPVAGLNPLVVRDSTLACRAVARVDHASRLDKQ
jgi:hypothetical protein